MAVNSVDVAKCSSWRSKTALLIAQPGMKMIAVGPCPQSRNGLSGRQRILISAMLEHAPLPPMRRHVTASYTEHAGCRSRLAPITNSRRFGMTLAARYLATGSIACPYDGLFTWRRVGSGPRPDAASGNAGQSGNCVGVECMPNRSRSAQSAKSPTIPTPGRR